MSFSETGFRRAAAPGQGPRSSASQTHHPCGGGGSEQDLNLTPQEMRREQGLGPPLQLILNLPLGSCGRRRLEGLTSSLGYSPAGCSLCSVDFYSSVNLLHKASLFPPQGRLSNPFSNLLKSHQISMIFLVFHIYHVRLKKKSRSF